MACNRHLEYCRRTKDRPRVRVRPCCACSAAKVKCDRLAQCSRCVTKGLDCVYRLPGYPSAGKDSGLGGTPPGTALTPSPRDDSQHHSSTGLSCILDVPDHQMTWDISMEPFLTTVISSPLADIMPTAFGPGQVTLSTMAGSITESDQVETLSPANPGTKQPLLREEGLFICMPRSDPVAQQNATYILQMIRPYPSMMTRKDTLPPFIHSCLGSSDLGLAFPEPLANCLSIARMFVWRTPETRDFVWKTIWAEQRRLAEKVQTLSPRLALFFWLLAVADRAFHHRLGLTIPRTYSQPSKHSLSMLSCVLLTTARSTQRKMWRL